MSVRTDTRFKKEGYKKDRHQSGGAKRKGYNGSNKQDDENNDGKIAERKEKARGKIFKIANCHSTVHQMALNGDQITQAL